MLNELCVPMAISAFIRGIPNPYPPKRTGKPRKSARQVSIGEADPSRTKRIAFRADAGQLFGREASSFRIASFVVSAGRFLKPTLREGSSEYDPHSSKPSFMSSISVDRLATWAKQSSGDAKYSSSPSIRKQRVLPGSPNWRVSISFERQRDSASRIMRVGFVWSAASER